MKPAETLILVPRVKNFANQYITKASEYSGNEKTISKIALLVFNSDGDLINISTSTNASVKLNRTMLNSPAQQGKLSSATVVMLANVELGHVRKSSTHSLQTEYDALSDNNPNTVATLTLADIENYSIHIPEGKSVITPAMLNDTDNPFTGFPMIGASSIDFTSNDDAKSIDLKILYAKVNFEIAVEEGGENQKYDGDKYENAMTFSMNNCKVFNTSLQTSIAYPTESGKPKFEFWGVAKEPGENAALTSATTANHENQPSQEGQSELLVHSGGKADLGTENVPANKITFTFYMSENRFNPNSDLTGIYPDDIWLSTTDYDDYKQHYKPLVAAKSGSSPTSNGKNLATYVVLNGTYVDYRGTSWAVDYTVYLGKDNYQNFQIDRNSEYTNYLSIKGIRNNSSYTDDKSVWVDHRVNVDTDDLSKNITITRETLIDSHFEVRPLRVTWNSNKYVGACVFLPRYGGKQIAEDKGGANENWVAIENNDGTRYQDITKYCANGKRKYFTTDLIEELHLNNLDIEENNKERVIPLENNDCIWIYIDEYTATSAQAPREAQIELRFYKNSAQYDSEIYTIRQHPLTPAGDDYMESYEEYLHSYDSEDKYNLETSVTDYTQKGIVWGLDGETLSEEILVSLIQLYGFYELDIRNVISQRYDYASASDGNGYPYIKSGNSWTSVDFENGLWFTNRASAAKRMTITDMGTEPSSAYQYCLSKNKFKKGTEGSHSMDIHWYLPDVSELQKILNANAQSSVDISSDASYWSSQPAYTTTGIENLPRVQEFLEENPRLAEYLKEMGIDVANLSVKEELADYARVVSKNNGVDKKSRTEPHRVRCFYSSTGIENVNMSNRAPDGIGPKVIHMRAKRRDTGGAGYFAQYVPPKATQGDPTPTKEFEGEDDDYAYPTLGDLVDGSFSYNPMENWVRTIKVGFDELYPEENLFTLYNYPGFSAKVISERKISQDGLWDYYHTIDETDEWKSDTEIVVSAETKTVDYSDLGDVTLKKLDGDNGIFSIDFSAGNNTEEYAPKYYYYEETGKVTETWTRHWMVPEYSDSNDEYDETLPEQDFTASDIVGRAGLYESWGNWKVATTNVYTQRYKSEADAKTAALNAAIVNAKSDIDTQVEKVRSANLYDKNPRIDYDEENARKNAKFDTKSDKSLGTTYYGVTYTVSMDATVVFTKSGNRTIWKYEAETGRWYNDTDEEWPNDESDKEDNEWPNYYKKDVAPNPKIINDELTFYSGNTLTISVDQGYVIGGVKLYFSDDNNVARNKYLRFVPEGYSSDKSHPAGMSFTDGSEGYAEWGTTEGCSGVTLQLAECTLTDPSWLEQLFGSTATINYKTKDLSYMGESVIIEKIEITYLSASSSNPEEGEVH